MGNPEEFPIIYKKIPENANFFEQRKRKHFRNFLFQQITKQRKQAFAIKYIISDGTNEVL